VVDERHLDVINPHNPTSIDVDDLMIEHVFVEQYFAVTANKTLEIDLGRIELNGMQCYFCEMGRRYKKCTPTIRRNNPTDGWITAIIETYHDVDYATDIAPITRFDREIH
jgi:hypothetical protein